MTIVLKIVFPKRKFCLKNPVCQQNFLTNETCVGFKKKFFATKNCSQIKCAFKNSIRKRVSTRSKMCDSKILFAKRIFPQMKIVLKTERRKRFLSSFYEFSRRVGHYPCASNKIKTKISESNSRKGLWYPNIGRRQMKSCSEGTGHNHGKKQF